MVSVIFYSTMGSRKVLVREGPHSRVVQLEADNDTEQAIRRTFANLLPVALASSLVVQLKDEEWNGEFVDLKEGQAIPDHSVLNVIPQVGTMNFAKYFN